MGHHPKPAWYRVSARAIIRRGDTILFLEEDGVLNLPGGGVEHGEDAASALRRELLEELGLGDVTCAASPAHVTTYYDPTRGKAKVWLMYEVGIVTEPRAMEKSRLHWLGREQVADFKLAGPLAASIEALYRA